MVVEGRATVVASSERRVRYRRPDGVDGEESGAGWELYFIPQLKTQHCVNCYSYNLLTQGSCIPTTWSIYIVVALKGIEGHVLSFF